MSAKPALTAEGQTLAAEFLSQSSAEFQRLLSKPGMPRVSQVFLDAMEKGWVPASASVLELPAAASAVPGATKAASEAVESAVDDASRAGGAAARGIGRAIAGGLLVGILDAITEGLVDSGRREANRAKIEAAVAIGIAAVMETVFEFWAVPKTLPDTDMEGSRRKRRTNEKRYRRHWRSRKNR